MSAEPSGHAERGSAVEEPELPSLRESLLVTAPGSGRVDRGRGPFAYSLGGILLASVFIAYHAAILLIWNGPKSELFKPFTQSFAEATHAQAYFQGTANTQSWAMFAPNPNRTNAFIEVLVTDPHGEVWDFEQDIWGEDRYPYFWYDRRGKVNRRLDGKKGYQRMFAAWVCREWERRNGGESPKSVRFIRRWTRVPHPHEVLAAGGWNQWAAPYKQLEQETILCKAVVHGQLPNVLRARYDLPAIDEEKRFRRILVRSWWDEQEVERKRERKQRERDAGRKRWQARQAAREAEGTADEAEAP